MDEARSAAWAGRSLPLQSAMKHFPEEFGLAAAADREPS